MVYDGRILTIKISAQNSTVPVRPFDRYDYIVKRITVRASSSNTGSVLVGEGDTDVYPLAAGDSVILENIPVHNLSVSFSNTTDICYMLGGGLVDTQLAK